MVEMKERVAEVLRFIELWMESDDKLKPRLKRRIIRQVARITIRDLKKM